MEKDIAALHDELLALELPLQENVERLTDMRCGLSSSTQKKSLFRLREIARDLAKDVEEYKEYVEKLVSDSIMEDLANGFHKNQEQ